MDVIFLASDFTPANFKARQRNRIGYGIITCQGPNISVNDVQIAIIALFRELQSFKRFKCHLLGFEIRQLIIGQPDYLQRVDKLIAHSYQSVGDAIFNPQFYVLKRQLFALGFKLALRVFNAIADFQRREIYRARLNAARAQEQNNFLEVKIFGRKFILGTRYPAAAKLPSQELERSKVVAGNACPVNFKIAIQIEHRQNYFDRLSFYKFVAGELDRPKSYGRANGKTVFIRRLLSCRFRRVFVHNTNTAFGLKFTVGKVESELYGLRLFNDNPECPEIFNAVALAKIFLIRIDHGHIELFISLIFTIAV